MTTLRGPEVIPPNGDGYTGRGVDRTDGRLKVTGAAKYTADLPLARLTHAMLVQSTVGKGRLTGLDTREAEATPGVIAVLTSRNFGGYAAPPPGSSGGGQTGEKRLPLSDDVIHYNGQAIAVVVAETLEAARLAASLVRATYATETPVVDLLDERAERYAPEQQFGRPLEMTRGDFAAAYDNATHKIDVVYSSPIEHHNPMEPHATIASWTGDSLTVYDATQGVVGCRKTLASTFGLDPKNVRVVSHFIGGGFGCKGSVWPHVLLATAASRKVGRPVKLVVTRQQMFSNNGHRPPTRQHIRAGVDAHGKLVAWSNEVLAHTSTAGEFVESAGMPFKSMYPCANVAISHELAKVNLGTPTYMRAPGESTGTYSVEVALDELAYAAGIDPLEFRLRNDTRSDPDSGKPFSTRHLAECLHRGADVFGWQGRPMAPGSLRDGRWLIGWGLATATYPAHQSPAGARATIDSDGDAVVVSATQDIGTGTYTIMTQIAADALGAPIEKVRFDLGDTEFPEAPVSGGSQTAASVGPAVRAAALALKDKLVALAVSDPGSPLHGLERSRIEVKDGRMYQKDEPPKGETYAKLLQRRGLSSLEAEAQSGKPGAGMDDKQAKFAFRSFGANFCEARVAEDTGEIRIARFVGAYDVGRVLNRKTARSQAFGGIMMGLGMALMEETFVDGPTGRIVTRNLADYHVPVHADVPAVEAIFIDEPDLRFNAVGARGAGEIPITGVAAAVVNAVYHATGKRIRDLPLTPDKLL